MTVDSGRSQSNLLNHTSSTTSTSLSGDGGGNDRKRDAIRPAFPSIDKQCIPSVIAYCFGWYGVFLGKYPIVVLLLFIAIGGACCGGLYKIGILLQMGGDNMNERYSPTDSRAVKDGKTYAAFSDEQSYSSINVEKLNKYFCSSGYKKEYMQCLNQTEFSETGWSARDLNCDSKPLTLPSDRNRRRKRESDSERYNCDSNPYWVRIMLIAKPGVNLWSSDGLAMDEADRVDNEFRTFSVFEEIHGTLYSYDGNLYGNNPGIREICPTTWVGGKKICNGYGIKELMKWMGSDDVIGDFVRGELITDCLPYPLFNDDGMFVDIRMLVGGVQTSTLGCVRKASSFQSSYLISDCFMSQYPAAYREWRQKVLDYIHNYNGEYFDLLVNEKDAQADAQWSLISSLLPKTGIIFVAVCVWCVFNAITMDAVGSKPYVGIVGIFSTFFACGAGFGIMCWLDYKVYYYVFSAPLLTLAIGLDDMFILLAAWNRTNPALKVEEKMMLTMKEGGTSILITFFINIIGFLVGTYAPYEAINDLSNFALATMFFDFVFQMTILPSSMALIGRSEGNSSHSCCCCFVNNLPTKEEAIRGGKGAMSVVCCSGGGWEPKEGEEDADLAEESLELDALPAIKRFLLRDFAPFLLRPVVKACVIVSYIIYLALFSYFAATIFVGMGRLRLFDEGSMLSRYFEGFLNHYQQYGRTANYLINNRIVYSDPEVQENLNQMIVQMNSSDLIAPYERNFFWWADFINWTRSIDGPVNCHQFCPNVVKSARAGSACNNDRRGCFDQCFGPGTPRPKDDEALIRMLTVSDMGNPMLSRQHRNIGQENLPIMAYSEGLLISSDGKNIEKSLFFAQSWNMSFWSRNVDSMIFSRYIADSMTKKGIEMVAYEREFRLYETFMVILPTTLYYIGVTLGSTILVAIVMLPSITCIFWVAYGLISIMLGLVGIMNLMGLDLDTITMMTLLVAIGLAADFVVHGTYLFLLAECPSYRTASDVRVYRAKLMIADSGSAALPAACGTFIALLPLASTVNYTLYSFFRVMLAAILCAVYHAVIVLPVMLSFFGPIGNHKMDKGATNDVESTETDSQISVDEKESKSTQEEEYGYFERPNHIVEWIRNVSDIPSNQLSYITTSSSSNSTPSFSFYGKDHKKKASPTPKRQKKPKLPPNRLPVIVYPKFREEPRRVPLYRNNTAASLLTQSHLLTSRTRIVGGEYEYSKTRRRHHRNHYQKSSGEPSLSTESSNKFRRKVSTPVMY